MLEGQTCEYCGDPAEGSFGYIYNNKKTGYACNFCYEHVAHFRPLLFKWTPEYCEQQIEWLMDAPMCPKVMMAIEKYEEARNDCIEKRSK